MIVGSQLHYIPSPTPDVALRDIGFFLRKMEAAKKRHLFPIRVKTALIVVIFGMILAEIAMVYFSLVTSSTNRENYKNTSTKLAYTVALSIDKEKAQAITDKVSGFYNDDPTKPGRDQQGTPEYETYMAKFETVRAMQEYKDIQAYLHAVKLANNETDGVYLGYVDLASKHAIYVCYDEENEDFPLGIIDDLYEEDYPMVETPEIGFVASIYTDEATGLMLATTGAPVYGPNGKIPSKSGNIICYAFVDIRMDAVRALQAERIVRLFVYLMSTVVLLSIIGIIVINVIIIRPVKALQKAAMSYDVNNPDQTHEIFKKLDVKVHDEFQNLAEAMKTMENDVNLKIHELMQANDALAASQLVAGKMAELANKDALTGVRNKIAFDNVVKSLNEKISKGEEIEFGLAMIDLNYLKDINDNYGHDSGDRALVKLCNLICAIFAHSPVYRVGGDEFIVYFKNRDYNEAKQLVAEFEDKIAKLSKDKDLSPEEQVSAAIGYTAYIEGKDTSVDDVFKRADQLMYVNKRKMKKKTR